MAVRLLTLPSGADVVETSLAASRGLQRAVVLLKMNGLASPRGISAKPEEHRQLLII